MMPTWTMTRFIFVLLFCEYLQVAFPLTSPGNSMDDKRRLVHFAAQNDPCYKLPSLLNIEGGIDVLNDVCKAVLTHFNDLHDDEKKGCPNAGNAECKCQGFARQLRCTFMCDVEEIDWTAPPIKKSRGTPLERQKKTERKPRVLPIIAGYVQNPDKPLPPQAPPIALLQNQLTASRLGPFRGDGTSKYDSRKRRDREF